tara:strand:+ start:30777 stop:31496 length:720 start_codon:yes stop_codon:yes gene_type:complete
MSFRIIPAIDIIDGKCVRLSQGDYSKKTIYDENPKSVAENFVDHGFKLVHVIDLDGAKVGEPINLKVVEDIASLGIKVELGGGLRGKEHFYSALNAGAESLILGTKLLGLESKMLEWVKLFPNCFIAGIDAKKGMVATDGWEKTSSVDAKELVKRICKLGFKRVIYTDIKKDGMLNGPNIKELESFAKCATIPIIASGGISSLADIKKIKSLSHLNVNGAIVGKAIYEGIISIYELSRC